MSELGCRAHVCGFVCLNLLFAVACAHSVRAAAETSAEPIGKKDSLFEAIKKDLADRPRRLPEDSRDTFFKAKNITALLLAGGASVAMNQDADKEIAEHFEEHGCLDGFEDESLNVIGHPATHLAAAALWYIASVENQDQFNKERASTLMVATSVSQIVTTALKAIRDNESPNGKNWAWPSGHTASSITVASVLDEFYGPKVGIPAYAVAGLVAYRMMDTGDHWGSDVVFGATLGWVVGHSIAGKHKKAEQLEVAGFKILPYSAGRNGTLIGLSFMKQF